MHTALHRSAFAVPNSRDSLHLEALTPNGPRRRCHPHFRSGGGFETGVFDFLIKLTDPQLRGPAAHWEGICLECRKTLGIEDLLRARQARIDAPICRHGTCRGEPCELCDVALRLHKAGTCRGGPCELCDVALGLHKEFAGDDVPLEGWAVLPFGPAVMVPGQQTADIAGRPQLLMRGPYRLRLHVEPIELCDQIYITRIQIGQRSLPLAWGEIWGWAFQDVDPGAPIYERLLPLAGPLIDLGNHVTVGVRNGSCRAATISIVLFGHGIDERADRQRAAGVPSTRAGARRLREADPGRPPQLPGNLSVRGHQLAAEKQRGYPLGLAAWCNRALGMAEDLDAQFLSSFGDADCDVYGVPAALPQPSRQASYLELGSELFELARKPGKLITYEGKGDALRDVATGFSIVRQLERFWTPSFDGVPPDPALFVPPRFTVAGVEFEVRRCEPPAPPEMSEAEKRAREAAWHDQAASIAFVLARDEADANETAWASATDEDP